MAAGMIYTIGGSFWEFGGPDLERAKLFVMIGTAEDHHSNPLKIAISKFKRDGGRFVSINPIRDGRRAGQFKKLTIVATGQVLEVGNIPGTAVQPPK